ncbi:hypothetical protein DPMN_016391 [Dreissena polymorpha]|uniref:Uncharacterized protein n=1 Tax=Dreissena polymorpha TaxID=45954 RepID=A0A9D4S5H1_DREPO|nr:hypothetical protein DPMN_016391 [Dreissena polymorpha]
MFTLQVTRKGIPPQAMSGARGASATATETLNQASSDTDDYYDKEEQEEQEEQEEADAVFLTREYCIGLPLSARVMKGRRSCKYND